jgi:hypothetical protein
VVSSRVLSVILTVERSFHFQLRRNSCWCFGPTNAHVVDCGNPNSQEVPLGEVWGRRVAGDHSPETPEQSADRLDRKLLADLSSQAIVDFRVTGDRSFRAGGRISINRVPATLAI